MVKRLQWRPELGLHGGVSKRKVAGMPGFFFAAAGGQVLKDGADTCNGSFLCLLGKVLTGSRGDIVI